VDAVLSLAGRALSGFDPLGALEHVALRDDAPALALRGVAMAQLGELEASLKLLRRAARAFDQTDPLAAARCLAALGEVALECRELREGGRVIGEARAKLARIGDRENAAYVRMLEVRRRVLLGDLAAAQRLLGATDLRGGRPALIVGAALLAADIASRELRPRAARGHVRRAVAAARLSRMLPLVARAERAASALDTPVARLVVGDGTRAVRLDEVEGLLHSGRVVIDGCRRAVRCGATQFSLATRPVLFALLLLLGEAHPLGATRDALVFGAFGARKLNESHRSRLRVEIGRLRAAVRSMVDIRATPEGFSLVPRRGDGVHILLPPTDGDAGGLLALLSGGQAWSTSALAAAVGKSQRAVQRALGVLQEQGKVRALGRGRARRWASPPPPGFMTTLLLVSRDDA
jgi:hypothetical protein